MMRFVKTLSAFLLAAGLSLAAHANPQAGKEYKVLSPAVPVETGAKVELLEIFWYGCPHCFDLEPVIHPYAQKLPKDVQFRRMPGIFRDSWVPGAKAFYALEGLGKLEQAHGDLFNEIHLKNLRPDDEKGLAAFLVKAAGIDAKAFNDAYNSFAMQSKVARAKSLTRAYGIDGVPALVVDGKYVTSVYMAGNHANLLKVLDFLIDKARKERKK